ncbi:MAG: flagellar hook capping FlgD N-terminal domain-containing protein [Pirellulaceae bacterium]|nr:hypothetical protein [Planctomycetales bacterium]
MALQTINSAVGRDEFLTLLVTQLQNQDPLNPTSSENFTTQLAQFSQLEGVEQLNASFSEMLRLQELTQSSSLVGKIATYKDPDTGQTLRGPIESAFLYDGHMHLAINDDAVSLQEISGITNLQELAMIDGLDQLNANFESMMRLQEIAQANSLIGRTVAYQVDNSTDLKQGVIEQVQVTEKGVTVRIDGKDISTSRVREIADASRLSESPDTSAAITTTDASQASDTSAAS